MADAQVIAMALSAFKRLGLHDVGLQLNSIGCPTCRKEYHKALKEYFTARKDQLCDTCLSRLERNPMRILDCKSLSARRCARARPAFWTTCARTAKPTSRRCRTTSPPWGGI